MQSFKKNRLNTTQHSSLLPSVIYWKGSFCKCSWHTLSSYQLLWCTKDEEVGVFLLQPFLYNKNMCVCEREGGVYILLKTQFGYYYCKSAIWNESHWHVSIRVMLHDSRLLFYSLHFRKTFLCSRVFKAFHMPNSEYSPVRQANIKDISLMSGVECGGLRLRQSVFIQM